MGPSLAKYIATRRMEEKWPALDMVSHVRDDCPEKQLKSRFIFTSKQTPYMAPRLGRRIIDLRDHSYMESEINASEKKSSKKFCAIFFVTRALT